MRIAIIGGGYAGLSAAVHALAKGLQVDVYASKASFASHISTGFFHPYVGRFPVKPKDANIWMQATESLLQEAQSVSEKPLVQHQGMFRPALFSAQEKYFRKLAKKEKDLLFWPEEEAREKIPGIQTAGLFLPFAKQIASSHYIEALRKVIVQRNGVFYTDFCLVKEYDAIVFAQGAYTKKHIPSSYCLEVVKGQLLVVEAFGLDLAFPLLGYPHISPYTKPGQFLIGATYEKPPFLETEENANRLLQQFHYFSLPKNSKIVGRKVGFRLRSETNRPLLEKIAPRKWVFTALSSKGLLWHAYFGEKLIEQLVVDLKNAFGKRVSAKNTTIF